MSTVDKLMRRNRLKKILLILVSVLLVVAIVGPLLYIHVYDAAKPIRFDPTLDKSALARAVDGFEKKDGTGERKVSVPEKAEVVVTYAPGDAADLPVDDIDYLVVRLEDAEVAVNLWYYSPVGDVYRWLSHDAPDHYGYPAYYGEDMAIIGDLPAYRYQLDCKIAKDGTLYNLHLFCKNPDDLYAVLTETAQQIEEHAK